MSQDPRQATPAGPQEERDFLDQAKLIGALIAGAALILFFFQNLQEVEVGLKGVDAIFHMAGPVLESSRRNPFESCMFACDCFH